MAVWKWIVRDVVSLRGSVEERNWGLMSSCLVIRIVHRSNASILESWYCTRSSKRVDEVAISESRSRKIIPGRRSKGSLDVETTGVPVLGMGRCGETRFNVRNVLAVPSTRLFQ